MDDFVTNKHPVANWAFGEKNDETGFKRAEFTYSSSSTFCGCPSALRRALVMLELPCPPIKLCSSLLAKAMS